MKYIHIAILIISIIIISLTGCMADVVEAKVVLTNDTDFELRFVVFDIPQSSGSYSPMCNIITSKDLPLKPKEERTLSFSLPKSDFGNSGVALIGLEDDGSSEFLTSALGDVILKRDTNRFLIKHNGESFIIINDNK